MNMTAKQVAIMAISAALYAVFFVLSKLVPGLPTFTTLYLPAILLSTFPIWFGWSGLAGGMIGAYVGGVLAEGLPLHVAWAESTTTLLIYGLNWLLIPKIAAEAKTKKGIAILSGVNAATLLAGTAYVLWMLSILGTFPMDVAALIFLPTYLLNLAIILVVCPILIRRISPKLKNSGLYSGTFWEWRSRRKAQT